MEYFVGRQPIFDARQIVYGYELLYRSGSGNFCDELDGDRATSEVITSSFLLLGLDRLTRGRKAFINFTRNLLVNKVASNLPRESIVVEIIETVEPDEKILEAVRELKDLGYLIALDDFEYSPRLDPLVELADIIKVDFLQTPPDQCQNVIKQVKNKRVKFLAEKVENRDDFANALKWGYTYFQGYFFQKPDVISGKDIPSLHTTYIQLLREINRPELDIPKIETIIKEDVALSYKLLKFINSVAFGIRHEIHSIRQALTLLGARELGKWVSLVCLRGLGMNKPDEIIVTAISRAHFCEAIAPLVGLKQRSADLFLMGLMSMIDALLDQPLPLLMEQLPVAKEIKEALLGEESVFADVLMLIKSYEKADGETLNATVKKLNLDQKVVIDTYIKSLESVNELME
ncbi:MAG: EAL and HDOD domain-containing protein [Candidatus Saccharibacteria bacterium]